LLFTFLPSISCKFRRFFCVGVLLLGVQLAAGIGVKGCGLADLAGQRYQYSPRERQRCQGNLERPGLGASTAGGGVDRAGGPSTDRGRPVGRTWRVDRRLRRGSGLQTFDRPQGDGPGGPGASIGGGGVDRACGPSIDRGGRSWRVDLRRRRGPGGQTFDRPGGRGWRVDRWRRRWSGFADLRETWGTDLARRSPAEAWTGAGRSPGGGVDRACGPSTDLGDGPGASIGRGGVDRACRPSTDRKGTARANLVRRSAAEAWIARDGLGSPIGGGGVDRACGPSTDRAGRPWHADRRRRRGPGGRTFDSPGGRGWRFLSLGRKKAAGNDETGGPKETPGYTAGS